MELINRDECVFSGARDLEHLYTFRDFPVFMGCVETPPEDDLKTDMSWWISRSTGSIQLNPLIPLHILYGESHGSGSVGALWERHHTEFARFIHAHTPGKMLEIGAGHGVLAKSYMKLEPDVRWIIVEPNPAVSADFKGRVIKGLFDENFALEEEVDAIIHSHVLEHVYYPFKFIQHISQFIESGKKMIFSVPNLKVMLQRKYTNCINFEHTCFLTEEFIEYTLKSFGFIIKDKEYFLDDHSIFYAAVREPGKINCEIPKQFSENKLIYTNYIDYHIELINALNKQIQGIKQPVFLFGGHVFSQYLLGFGLDQSRISCILDNDPNKHGKRLYGSRLFVQSPKILADVPDPCIILKAGVYNDEIKQDILGNINPRAVFL